MLIEVRLAEGALATSGPPSSAKMLWNFMLWSWSQHDLIPPVCVSSSASLEGRSYPRSYLCHQVWHGGQVRSVTVHPVSVVKTRGVSFFIDWIIAQPALSWRPSQCYATSARACASRVIVGSRCCRGLLTWRGSR
ncbi:hypothetical protein BHM03_00040138 [Ensete ventricosum]|nr:hypothetical protein BHM03_00040138 [Ensete ventricosum]